MPGDRQVYPQWRIQSSARDNVWPVYARIQLQPDQEQDYESHSPPKKWGLSRPRSGALVFALQGLEAVEGGLNALGC